MQSRDVDQEDEVDDLDDEEEQVKASTTPSESSWMTAFSNVCYR